MTTKIDAALASAISDDQGAPPKLSSAIRYAVFPGGARIRPRLCLAVAEACGNDAPAVVEAAACALELVHCASLVHDDLPCFDDASTRRGKPSVHRMFGEPLAVLTGDALIVLAFETLARGASQVPSRLAPLTLTLARAIGTPGGLIAGQAWESEPAVPLEPYHRAKTGSLFMAATMSGAIATGRDPQPWRAMGERLGEAYQVADDLLDALARRDEAGKPIQQDAALGRPNAVAILGVEGAVTRLRQLVAEAAASVPACAGAPVLRGLVLEMAERLVPASLKQFAA
ncbi:MAG: polyprenyl synthetase family protein [Labilithrix sp.]